MRGDAIHACGVKHILPRCPETYFRPFFATNFVLFLRERSPRRVQYAHTHTHTHVRVSVNLGKSMKSLGCRRRSKCEAPKQALFATLCLYVVSLLCASFLGKHFYTKPSVAITCATKDWSCGSTLYEELARELRRLGLYTVFKRGWYLTSSSPTEFSMYFVGADYELPTAMMTKEYTKSTLRVMLHLEPYDLNVRKDDHQVDMVLTTTQLSPVSSFPVVIYVPYFFISLWQTHGDKASALQGRSIKKSFLKNRGFMVYATSHCKAGHRTDFYDFVAANYRPVEYGNMKCGKFSVPSLTSMRSDRRKEKSWMNSVISHYSKYKFAVVFENAIVPGYVTEKLLLARLAGTIPVYYGTAVVHEFINSDAFIDCTPGINESQTMSYARCLEKIKRLDMSEVLWLETYSAPFLRGPIESVATFLSDIFLFFLRCKKFNESTFPSCGQCSALAEEEVSYPKFSLVSGCPKSPDVQINKS